MVLHDGRAAGVQTSEVLERPGMPELATLAGRPTENSHTFVLRAALGVKVEKVRSAALRHSDGGKLNRSNKLPRDVDPSTPMRGNE